MKRFLSLALALLLGLSAFPAFAEEDAFEPPNTENMLLPLGIWMLIGDGTWIFSTQTDATLTPDQRKAADETGVTHADGVMPSGSALTIEQLTALDPGTEGHLGMPLREPELTLFGLDGEWYYGDDDVLYYDHGDGYTTLTVDEVFAMLNGSGPATSGDEKIIYLTIDDTPGLYTMDMLATLKKLNVKATFFVVGAYVKRYPVFLRAIYEQGHTIANHSYSHDAGNLKSSLENCLADFRRCEKAVEEALGFPLEMPILRVPYGAGILPVSYRTGMQKAGYLWIDWNALNGDTEPDIKSDADALHRAISTASRYDGGIVMLVHDGKLRTIRTMEEMVKHFREQGYEFRMLDTNIEKIPGVRMGLPL